MSTRLSLPNELSEDTNHLITFDCIKLFGEEFGKYCDLKMQEIEGPEWLKNLGILRQQYKNNLFDIAKSSIGEAYKFEIEYDKKGE